MNGHSVSVTGCHLHSGSTWFGTDTLNLLLPSEGRHVDKLKVLPVTFLPYLIQCCTTGIASWCLKARISDYSRKNFNCSKIICKLFKVKFMHLLFLLIHLLTTTSVACLPISVTYVCILCPNWLTWHSPILTSNICVSNITKCHQKILGNYKII
jgi:hypothetical protein